MAKLPTFLIIGGTKCGTTSLFAYLDAHPDVFMAPKELRYFSAAHNHHRGPSWYRAQFEGAEGFAAVGEASNAYTRDPVYPGVPERIARLLPEARLLYLVRDPMRRIESHWRHRLVTGTEWRSADAALRADPGYVAASLYGRQLSLYLDRFERERILVVRSEGLFAEPDRWLARICGFIGVAPADGAGFGAENVTAGRMVMPAPVRQIARLPAARAAIRRASWWLQRRRPGGLATGDRPAFALSEGHRAELEAVFAQDGRLLVEIAGEDAAPRAPAEPAARTTAAR